MTGRMFCYYRWNSKVGSTMWTSGVGPRPGEHGEEETARVLADLEKNYIMTNGNVEERQVVGNNADWIYHAVYIVDPGERFSPDHLEKSTNKAIPKSGIFLHERARIV